MWLRVSSTALDEELKVLDCAWRHCCYLVSFDCFPLLPTSLIRLLLWLRVSHRPRASRGPGSRSASWVQRGCWVSIVPIPPSGVLSVVTTDDGLGVSHSSQCRLNHSLQLWQLLLVHDLDLACIDIKSIPSAYYVLLPLRDSLFSVRKRQIDTQQCRKWNDRESIRWHGGKESACKCGRCKRPGFDPWVRKICWRRTWLPISSPFLPRNFHGLMSLAGYSPAKSWTQLGDWTHEWNDRDH